MPVAAVGPNILKKFQDAGILSKDLMIRRIVIDIQTNEAIKVYYETFVDKLTLDFCLDELVKHKDKLTVSRVVQKLDKSIQHTT